MIAIACAQTVEIRYMVIVLGKEARILQRLSSAANVQFVLVSMRGDARRVMYAFHRLLLVQYPVAVVDNGPSLK